MSRIVLVADDSPTIQKRALGILKGEGFEVETVSNGVAAIKRLAVLQPVVVLADVSMPGRDGYEVCEFVKKSAGLSHVPVLLVASDMEPYDDARGAEVRADGIIKKPFEAQDLISTVERFAAQFEAATSGASSAASMAEQEGAISGEQPDAAAAPDQQAAPEPVPDFAISNESTDFVSAPMQPLPPDFSLASEGVALTEPAAEEKQDHPVGQEAGGIEFLFSGAQVEAERGPSFLERVETAAPEPVFIEESPAQPIEPHSHAHEFHTATSPAPLDIGEPVWKDETVPPPPEPEHAAAAALEPQLEPATPSASPESLLDQPLEPAPLTHDLSGTSLDSLSLEEATADQVDFASEPPAEESASAEEVVAPVAFEEIVPSEAPPVEPVHAEAAPVEVAYAAPVEESPATEAPTAQPAPEETVAETTPAEVAAEVGPFEHSPEAAAPPLPIDRDMINAVVHKVVVRMSPPPLPSEAVEEIARRLAEEIAAEITSELSRPPE